MTQTAVLVPPAAQSGYFGIDSNTADSLTDPKNDCFATVPTFVMATSSKAGSLIGTTYQAVGDQVTLTTTTPKVVLVAE